MAPPDHLHGDGRGVPQRAEDHAVAPVLGGGAFGGDPDAAAGRDHRQPVVDVAGFLEPRSRLGGPQVRTGGPGAPVDEHGALGYLVEPDGAAPGPGIVGGEGTVAPLVTDDGAGEAVAIHRGAQDRQVAQAFSQSAGGGVGADQLKFDIRVAGRPAVLELPGVTAHGRPGMADAEPGMAGSRLGDQIVRGGEDLPRLGQGVHARRGRGDGPAGAVQQPDAEDLLQGDQVP